MIYAIVPLEEEKDLGNLEDLVKEIDAGAYVGHAPHIFLVSYDGSRSELVKHLGFTSKSEHTKSGIVLNVTDYHGFANGEMWEWLISKKGMPS